VRDNFNPVDALKHEPLTLILSPFSKKRRRRRNIAN
jgi:hypothetical protein